MAQSADQQDNPPSVVGTLYNEHERTQRFQDNIAKRPRDCDANGSFETKWAFSVAESKRADVETKTSNQLTSATMTISFALREVKEEITELDSLLRGINVREHELDSMTNSLDKMCLTLAARSIDRKKQATAPRTSGPRSERVDTSGNCPGRQQLQQQQQHEDVDMQTAVTTITGPSSNVSTADEISMSEHPPPGTTVLPGPEQLANAPSPHHQTTGTTTAREASLNTARSPSRFATAHEASPTARSPSHFDYSALEAYTPYQRTPCKMDSTVICPRTAPKSRSPSRSRSERRS
ncbi:hypothetical protein PENTCL1PPCAC_20143 [Pristionchus entomophagus]|uniref:Tektin n=1 Tax=Pristionchus entomophagus TaxID=358040 RepID=A0AAV5TVA9_9BILA|nr:hypothetical protein PENTCL1PPCAC_20143 [Pristionchus entomophagus]